MTLSTLKARRISARNKSTSNKNTRKPRNGIGGTEENPLERGYLNLNNHLPPKDWARGTVPTFVSLEQENGSGFRGAQYRERDAETEELQASWRLQDGIWLNPPMRRQGITWRWCENDSRRRARTGSGGWRSARRSATATRATESPQSPRSGKTARTGRPGQMSRDNARQLLQAIEQDEKDTQEKVQEMKAKEREERAQENRRRNKNW